MSVVLNPDYEVKFYEFVAEYGIDKMYQEIKSFEPYKSDKKFSKRNFHSNVTRMKEGIGYFKKVDILALMLDKLGLDLTDFVLNGSTKLDSALLVISHNNDIASVNKKGKKLREINEKSLFKLYSFYSNVKNTYFNYGNYCLSKWNIQSDINFSPNLQNYNYYCYEMLLKYIISDKTLRHKLKQDQYSYVLEAIILPLNKNSQNLYIDFDNLNFDDFSLRYLINYQSPCISDELSICISLFSIYLFSIQQYLSSLRNKKNVNTDALGSNISDIKGLIKSVIELLKEIKNKHLVIYNDDGSNIDTIKIIGTIKQITIYSKTLSNSKIMPKYRYSQNLHFNSLLSWITMTDESSPEIHLKEFDSEVISVLNYIISTDISSYYASSIKSRRRDKNNNYGSQSKIEINLSNYMDSNIDMINNELTNGYNM